MPGSFVIYIGARHFTGFSDMIDHFLGAGFTERTGRYPGVFFVGAGEVVGVGIAELCRNFADGKRRLREQEAGVLHLAFTDKFLEWHAGKGIK